MGRANGNADNKLRGYKAAISNPRVSEPAKSHAREELDRYQGTQSDDDRLEGNVKRGLKAAMHNPNNTDVGRQQARDKLEAMGEHPEQPAD
ncbi:hypothetical protein N7474_005167 [Penicillium riverlandense]|uniref:uncharacterized protein n=1 Tax=Penicillium riverlandense TaxID=1903569 RepID=UPI002547FA86|nr:uncharacterized protein N7474_005167 [Penicillium riverlandense]KAJ5819576.1 hypothetical protein N7474_005167 [Penicillium riverlandense]